jgi:histidinol phosphatase-like enzyme (inositol monophosphatase family)
MELRSFIEEIALKAGEITLKYFNNPNLRIETKANDTPVTQADQEAERYLREQIRKHFPNDSIIGEEYGEELFRSDRRWIIDPLDGTKTFMRGVPFYGTLIALEEGDTVTHGCIGLPALNEIIYAEHGKGCFWNGKSCHVSNTDTIEEATLLTTDDASLATKISQARHEALIQEAKLWRSWGDCYGYALVATGRADGMLDPAGAIWDLAPMAVILSEAGGRYSSFEGTKTIRGGDMISSNRALFTTLQEIAFPPPQEF